MAIGYEAASAVPGCAMVEVWAELLVVLTLMRAKRSNGLLLVEEGLFDNWSTASLQHPPWHCEVRTNLAARSRPHVCPSHDRHPLRRRAPCALRTVPARAVRDDTGSPEMHAFPSNAAPIRKPVPCSRAVAHNLRQPRGLHNCVVAESADAVADENR